MPRNFLRRIEVMFPVEDPALRARLLNEVLGIGLKDNVKARRLLVDGSYQAVEMAVPEIRSQLVLMDTARRAGEPKAIEPLIRHVAAPEVTGEPARTAPVASSA
jgi:polyphosphate kinase